MASQSRTNYGPLQDAAKYWIDFVSRCLSTRLENDRFRQFVQLVYAKHPVPPLFIAELFLRPQPSNNISIDPRVPPFIEILTELGYVDATSILRSLYKYSTMRCCPPDNASEHNMIAVPGTTSTQQGMSDGNDDDQASTSMASSNKTVVAKRWKDSYWAEEAMFYHVLRAVVEGRAFNDNKSALELVDVVCKWMKLLVDANNIITVDMLSNKSVRLDRDEVAATRAAFVPLLLRLIENQELVRIMSKPFVRGVRKELAGILGSFAQSLQPAAMFIERLEIFRTQTLAEMDPVDKNQQADNAVMDDLFSAVGLSSLMITEIPISNSRAALDIFLNAALVGRPILDDAQLYAFLNNRYQGNQQSSAIDLIIASFDLLANAVFRNEGQRDAHLLRSFVVNKLPLLLCQLCHPEFSTGSAEYCITEALNRVDTSVFPTASLMFDESRNNNPYTESIREEFCAACALHGLIERDHVDRILEETSMSYDPSLEKASQAKLVQDCLSDSGKIQSTISQLEKMDGNVGAVVHTIVELIRQLCINKETMSLKLLCTQLAQKPQSLDIILLFDKITCVLGPLCNLLDNWRYEEDQGEYQPVYEEYGAILLLVFAFTYRYNLSPMDIGIQSADSNVAKIIQRSHIARPQDELTPQELQHVNGWIMGLFDNETGGLGDELMSSCQPHEFYLLVATIFQSIITAYTYGYINDEILKGGIEYVVDTFLLPSLVPAIRFLSDHLWVDQKEQKFIIKALQLLLTPSSISGEASIMLASVKNLIAQPLVHSLRYYQRQDPLNQDIGLLLGSLEDNLLLSRRTASAGQPEMDAWANQLNQSLSGAIRQTIQSLVQWSAVAGVSSMPALYTHRQIVAGLRIMGPNRLLSLIMEEIRQQSEMGNDSFVYDVAAAIICATDSTNEPRSNTSLLDASSSMQMAPLRRPGLREALKTAAESFKKVQKHDGLLAEAYVRLYRRVEALMVMAQPEAVLGPVGMTLDMAAAATGADAMDVDGLGTTGLDMGLGADLSLSGAGGEGDLFGELDASMGMFEGWGGVDLSSN